MNEILQKHRFDPYNEVVVRFKDKAKKGACVCYAVETGLGLGKTRRRDSIDFGNLYEAFGLAETLNL